jgi:hypothetical protein
LSFFAVSGLGGELIRRVRVDASDIQSAEGKRSAAVVTRVSSGRGDNEMSVSDEDSVECLTNDDMD